MQFNLNKLCHIEGQYNLPRYNATNIFNPEKCKIYNNGRAARSKMFIINCELHFSPPKTHEFVQSPSDITTPIWSKIIRPQGLRAITNFGEGYQRNG